MTAPGFAERPTVYEPTVTGLPPLGAYFRAVLERRPLMWHLARTDLKAEHYATVLGQLWIILDPLLLAAVYYMVRSVVRPIGNDPELRNLLISHLIWALFFFRYTSRSLNQGARCVINGKQLIMNTSFPRMIFPLVAILKAFLDFLPTIAIYLIVHAILDQPFTTAMVMIPVIVLLQTFFNLGLAFLFAPLTVFFRDTSAFVPYLSQIWLYTTPILYTVSEIPENFRSFLIFNPLYPFIAALEQIFTGDWPSAGYIGAAAAWSFGLLLVGAVVFLVRERDFAVKF
jgi:ABC-type polysaccharide/polyol phosphate export permease